MKSGIKMATKQSTLLLMVLFFSLVLSSSPTKILYPEVRETIEDGGLPKNHSGRYSLERISTIHYSHGGSSGGGSVGGGVGGGRGTSGDGSQGDTTRNPNGAGAANMNHRRHGGSSRVQGSVFLTWVAAIFVTQFFLHSSVASN